ncbi:MAG: hypothetical protein ACLTAF_02515 [Blautia coccoides]
MKRIAGCSGPDRSCGDHFWSFEELEASLEEELGADVSAEYTDENQMSRRRKYSDQGYRTTESAGE